jgi:hypothetical protein
MTTEQLLKDVEFLADRATRTGRVEFNGPRDTGMSSNSIVAIAYGLWPLTDQIMPGDAADMASCERMWRKLPEHRKAGDALSAMEAARHSNYYGQRVPENVA